MVGCSFASPWCNLEKNVFMLKIHFLFVGIYQKVSMNLCKRLVYEFFLRREGGESPPKFIDGASCRLNKTKV